MLEIQPGIDLGGRDVGVPQQLLHRAQIATGLQHMAGKGVPQHVGMHRLRQPGLLAALAQTFRSLAVSYVHRAHRQTRLLPASAVKNDWHADPASVARQPWQQSPQVRCGACRPYR